MPNVGSRSATVNPPSERWPIRRGIAAYGRAEGERRVDERRRAGGIGGAEQQAQRLAVPERRRRLRRIEGDRHQSSRLGEGDAEPLRLRRGGPALGRHRHPQAAQVEPGRRHAHLVHRRQERHAELPVLGHAVGEVDLGARPERVDEVGDERRRVRERHDLRLDQLGGIEERPDILERHRRTPILDLVTHVLDIENVGDQIAL